MARTVTRKVGWAALLLSGLLAGCDTEWTPELKTKTLGFEQVPVGTRYGRDLQFTVKEPVSLLGYDLAGADAADFRIEGAGTDLGPPPTDYPTKKEVGRVRVSCAPSKPDALSAELTLHFKRTSGGDTKDVVVPLTCNDGHSPTFQVHPAPVDFGKLGVGKTASIGLDFAVAANTTASLQGFSLRAGDGGMTSEFSYTGDGASGASSFPAGGALHGDLLFTPAAGGARAGVAHFEFTGAQGESFEFDVGGTGIYFDVPSEQLFSVQKMMGSYPDATQSMVMTNVSASSFDVTGVDFAADQSAFNGHLDVQPMGTTLPTTLTASSTLTFVLTLHPGNLGGGDAGAVYTGTLTVHTSVGDAAVQVTANLSP